jgi:hypothetical protein
MIQKMILSTFLLGLCFKMSGQTEASFQRYLVQFASNQLKIQKEAFDITFFQADEKAPRIRTFYLKQHSSPLKLILSSDGAGCDTAEVWGYPFRIQITDDTTCEHLVIEESLIDLYHLCFGSQEYFILIGVMEGTAGSGSESNLMLILNKSRPEQSMAIQGRRMEIAHFIDYQQNRTLDLLYQDREGHLILLEIDTQKSKRLK